MMDACQFLEQYKRDIEALPVLGNTNNNTSIYLRNLDTDARRVFVTLLPLTAAIKHRRPELSTPALLEAVKSYCVKEIEQVIHL